MYKELKESLKAVNKVRSYEDILLNGAVSMFDYTGLSKEFSTFMEIFLLMGGECAVWKLENNLIVTPCTRIGNINEYGLGKDLNCTTRNGVNKKFIDFENNPNVVYVRNNSTATPDTSLEWFSTCLAEIDKSIMHNIINSRYSPIVKASNGKEKALIEQALESNNSSGIPQVVISGAESLFENKRESNNVLNITDVTNSDKIQYLSHAHDDIIRRLLNLYGMDIRGTGKMAQQSVAEINNGDNSQLIIPEDRLKNRKLAVEEINKKFGLNITVDYSKCWKREDKERETMQNSPDEIKESEVEDNV